MFLSLQNRFGSACTSILLIALSSSTQAAGELSWHADSLAKTVAAARTAEQPVLVYFWGGSSEYCAKFWEHTMLTEAAQTQLGHFALHSADNGTELGSKLVARFHVRTLPTVLVLTPTGEPEDVIAGFCEAELFVHELKRILSGEKTLSALRAHAAEIEVGSEKRLLADWTLAQKCWDVGLVDQQAELLTSIRTQDPKGKTAVGAELLLDDLMAEVIEQAGGEEQMGNWNLSPLVGFAKQSKTASARFVAWNKVGHIESKRGDITAAHKAFVHALDSVPEPEFLQWSDGVGEIFAGAPGECTSKEKKFVLELAQRGLDRVVSLADDPASLKLYTSGAEKSYESILAYRFKALAKAHEFNGNDKEALAAMARVKELAPESEYAGAKEKGKGKPWGEPAQG